MIVQAFESEAAYHLALAVGAEPFAVQVISAAEGGGALSFGVDDSH